MAHLTASRGAKAAGADGIRVLLYVMFFASGVVFLLRRSALSLAWRDIKSRRNRRTRRIWRRYRAATSPRVAGGGGKNGEASWREGENGDRRRRETWAAEGRSAKAAAKLTAKKKTRVYSDSGGIAAVYAGGRPPGRAFSRRLCAWRGGAMLLRRQQSVALRRRRCWRLAGCVWLRGGFFCEGRTRRASA